MRILLADISKALPQTEASLVERAQRAYGASSVEVLCLHPQEAALRSRSITSLKAFEPGGAYYFQIAQHVRQRILSVKASEPTSEIHVASFHSAILALSVSPDVGALAHFHRWSEIHAAAWLSFGGDESNRRPETPDASAWPEERIPLLEAINALKRALISRRAVSADSAVPQSSLRVWLAEEDGRLSKDGPLADEPRLVSKLVRQAKAKGLVATGISREPGNPPVYILGLTEQEIAGLPAPPPKKTASDSMSQKFIDELAKEGLGPFSKIRQALYKEISAAASAGGNVRIIDVLRAAIDTVQKSTATVYPWRKVMAFLIRVLSECQDPVMFDENNSPIRVNAASLLRPVRSAAPALAVEADSVLMLHLLRRGSVKAHDARWLSGALYLDQDDVERALEVIDNLVRKGLVDAGAADHILRVTSPTGATGQG